MKLRRRLLMLLAVMPLLSACKESKEDGGLPTPPISLPFAVQMAGTKIEISFRIEEERKYNFELGFRFNNQIDRKRVAKLVGHPKDEGMGVPIPLRIRVTRITPDEDEEVMILNKEISELTLTGYTADQFIKVIVSSHLSPGQYRASIESLKDVPELQEIQIEFAIVRAYIGK